jgi:hypothetical protein
VGLTLIGPIASCLFLLGLYNYLRFHSWTDFGLHNILQGLYNAKEYNFFNLDNIAYNFFYYVLVPPYFTKIFPFIRPEPHFYLLPPPNYMLERIIGILPASPLLSSFFLIPFLGKAFWRFNPIILFAATTFALIGLILLGFYCFFCAGTMRYEVDFASFFLISALLLWFCSLNMLKNKLHIRATISILFILLISLTVILNTAISLTGYYDNLERANPKTYQAIRRFFYPLEKIFGFHSNQITISDLARSNRTDIDFNGCSDDGWCGPKNFFVLHNNGRYRSVKLEGTFPSFNKHRLPLRIRTTINGVEAGSFEINKYGYFCETLHLPTEMLHSNPLKISLFNSFSVIPMEIGLNSDKRQLSYMLKQIILTNPERK